MAQTRNIRGRSYLQTGLSVEGLIGREYLRVSQDRSGYAKSNGEQHDENLIVCGNFRITLGEPYADPDRSASRYARKVREDFDRLIEDLREDRFGADFLVLWESSRGSRTVGEWVLLIDLLEKHGVRVLVTTHGRIYDPANPRDRRSLLEDAVDSEYESGKTHLRIRRDTAAAATKGRPHGRAPLGYRRVYDEKTGKLIGQVVDEETAPIVRALFRRLNRGHSLNSIARHFEAKGIRNPSGSPYTPAHLRVIALRHAYRGVRVHDEGKLTGGINPSPEARMIKAEWPALVSSALFDTVQEILRDPSRRTSRPGRGKYFMSIIARCGVCRGPMCVTDRTGVKKLICKDAGHVKIRMADVDTYAEKVLLLFLGDENQYRRLDGDSEETAVQLQETRAKLSKVRADHKDLTRRVRLYQRGEPGGLSMEMAADLEPDLLKLERELVAEEHRLKTPSAVSRLLGPGVDVAERWKNTPLSARRELAQLVFSPAGLGRFLVFRSPRPGVRGLPAAERVGFEQGDS